nr:hypothetical protein CFP56_17455 [Quercus suber]
MAVNIQKITEKCVDKKKSRRIRLFRQGFINRRFCSWKSKFLSLSTRNEICLLQIWKGGSRRLDLFFSFYFTIFREYNS